MNKSNYSEEAARLKMDMAYQALAASDREAAQNHFHDILKRLPPPNADNQKNQLRMQTTRKTS